MFCIWEQLLPSVMLRTRSWNLQAFVQTELPLADSFPFLDQPVDALTLKSQQSRSFQNTENN